MRSTLISCSKDVNHQNQQNIAKNNVRYNLLLRDVKRKTIKRLDTKFISSYTGCLRRNIKVKKNWLKYATSWKTSII